MGALIAAAAVLALALGTAIYFYRSASQSRDAQATAERQRDEAKGAALAAALARDEALGGAVALKTELAAARAGWDRDLVRLGAILDGRARQLAYLEATLAALDDPAVVGERARRELSDVPATDGGGGADGEPGAGHG